MKQRERKRAMLHGERGARRRVALRVRDMADPWPFRPFCYRLTQRKRLIPIDLFEAEALLGDADIRTVGRDFVGDLEVSTVFLVAPHGIFRRDFFETAVISEGVFKVVQRYPTWREAKAGHAEAVRALREAGA